MPKTTKYKYFMRTEPRQTEGPVELDEETGFRYQYWYVTMLRGSENRKRVKVYLDPTPHTIVDNAKPLQGWYKGKYEPNNVRPRPCETEAVLTQPYGGTCPVRCMFCMVGGTRVATPDGWVPIQSLRVGDTVWGRNVSGWRPAKVMGCLSRVVRRTLVLELADGRRLRLTPDHLIYSRIRGWVPAGQLKIGEEVETIGTEKDLRNLQRASYVVGSGAVLRTLFKLAAFSAHGVQEQRFARTAYSDAFVRNLWCSPGTYSVRQVLQTVPQISYEGDIRSHVGKPAREEATGVLPYVLFPDTQTPQTLRRLFQNPLQFDFQREQECLQTEGHQKVAGDSCANEGGVLETSESCGGAAEVFEVEAEDERAHALGQNGVPFIQTRCVQRYPHAFGVGTIGGRILGQRGFALGIRTCNASTGRRNVHTGFLAPGFAQVYRGERLFRSSEQGAVRAFSAQVPSRALGSEGAGTERYTTVIRKQVVRGSVVVYDVQTDTENFCADGVLVHNCYVNSGTRGYRGQGITTVPRNYGEFVRKSLSQMKTAAAGYFSSFTEPFLPLEDIYHNTQQAAEAFVGAGLPIFFLSRMIYPDWAYDLLRRNPYSYAQMSINCPDEKRWRRLSPWAPDLSDLIDQVESLHKAGIYVSIQINPIVPGVVSVDDIVELIWKLSKAGANHCIFKFVEVAHSWKSALIHKVAGRFGRDAADELQSVLNYTVGSQTTIDLSYRKHALDRFQAECKKAKVTMALCYEYEKVYDPVTGGMISRGVSMNPLYMTSDQCHGKRVPMFTRTSLGKPFREVKECPPSGCLRCADGDPECRGRCGSKLFGAAKALRMGDFKYSVYDRDVDPGVPCVKTVDARRSKLF